MPSNTENALLLSKRAVIFDRDKNYEAAAYCYKEAAKFLYLAVTNQEGTESERTEWKDKSRQYDARALALQAICDEEQHGNSQSFQDQALQRCNFLFGQALDADERGLRSIAVDLYGQTAEFALKLKDKVDDTTKSKILRRADQALTRGEELKAKNESSVPSQIKPAPSAPPLPSSTTVRPTATTSSTIRPNIVPGYTSDDPSSLKVLGGASNYTEEEKRVLRKTSKINGINYVPFMDVDLKEKFQYSEPFTDKDGLLKLSPKQKNEFSKWVRPEELYSDPKLIMPGGINFRHIKQTLVSDCSFVASLAVSALYEQRFSRKIITPILYPRNRTKDPIYNPFGKYMVKLHLNGVTRKVVIDDQLPVDKNGRLLCSYSTKKGELWVSLLEKAYMKVMGGYDFPGSNSNVDLHALTGWIPERISLRPNDADFNADSLFNMLESRLRSGHVLGTIATGDLSKQQENRTGLVPAHAYAILNVLTVDGARLMQLKNPWSHMRWRGNYSELDELHWTPQLKKKLNYDPDSAAEFDNGIFYIDYSSILHFFDVIYLNWDPEMFSYTYATHQSWKAGQGPRKDVFNMGESPQFRLHIPGNKAGPVWVLLSRHTTTIEDLRDNNEYIALVVYKTNGTKVYYPNDPEPFIDGARINSIHYLCKIALNETSNRTYTLVLSQYEKSTDIFYSLRAYSTLPFQLTKIESNYPTKKEVSGRWEGKSAGGSVNHPDTYPNNPCYNLKTDSPCNLYIDLKGPKQYPIGFSMKQLEGNDSSFGRKTPGPYRPGFVMLELEDVQPGIYNVTPTTYNPGQEGPFILTVKATCSVSITKVN